MNIQKAKALASVWGIISTLTLHALPQDAEVISGQIHSKAQQDLLQLTTSEQAIIHWKSFSIGKNEKVQFIQPSSTSAVLNRVKGTDASQLLGQLTANGKVYLINPNGVIFGKDAVIRTADFLASTLDLSDVDFFSSSQVFTGESREAIINYGTIEALEGNVILIGRIIDNQGALVASKGAVSIAAGQEILLKPEGVSILTIRPSLDGDGTLSHQGKIEALVAELQAEGQAYTRGINVEGSVLALNTVEQNGRIYLKADGVAIAPDGKLDAPQGGIAIEAGAKGLYLEGKVHASQGSIHITNTSEQMPFYNLGTLDVSGEHGGSIEIDTIKLINTGKILSEGTLADGGSIEIHTLGPYIETATGLLSVSGKQAGGTIFLQSDTTLFSSGTLKAQGTHGGEVTLLSPTLTLVSASLDASGSNQGGQIFVGGGAHGESRGAPNAKSTHLSGNTQLTASSTHSGDGGTVVVWSEERTVCHGSVESNAGVSGGNGGWIEVSSKEDLYCGASLIANSRHGTPGSVLLDPKNIVIDAVTGVYPQYEFIDPTSGSGDSFGYTVLVLSTGNVMIAKPDDDAGGIGAGAVYLYNGHTAALISTLTGSTAGDRIGIEPAVALIGNGNYVIMSPIWTNSGAANAGAVTWGSGITGVSGVVSASNSLVGNIANSFVGGIGIDPLTNGNYVVRSESWNDGVNTEVGAVTWGNGLTGVSGTISSSNSLVGSTTSDIVGSGGMTELTNGNYVIRSRNWTNSGAANAGAVTWGNGSSGTAVGTVSGSNSLVGSTANDLIGEDIIALTNGNYVVFSPNWRNSGAANAGAVTWGDGLSGIVGTVSASNSRVGTTADDFGFGAGGVTALANGNYVVFSPFWNNGGGITFAGAVSWGNGLGGTVGAITSSNSLVGTTAFDRVGNGGVIALTDDNNTGNYVAISTAWTTAAGAVTWGNGSGGTVGAVSSSNSLIGSSGDQVGSFSVLALTNGNYLVKSPSWNNSGATSAGAATWGDGTTGISGTVTSSNSLVGTQIDDLVGEFAFGSTNGNYFVISPHWGNADTLAGNVGAVTWGDGLAGIVGTVSDSNSLIGTTQSDSIGVGGIVELTNGNYVVISYHWNNTGAGAGGAGAVTWIDGMSPELFVGPVTDSNSLVGITQNSNVGSTGVHPLPINGNYVVVSQDWDDGAVSNVGAVTWGNGLTGIVGPVTSANSLVGSQTSDQVGVGFTVLTNGNYVVDSRFWSDGAIGDAGAASWGNGSTLGTRLTGPITSSNSLIGASPNDNVGRFNFPLSDGNYVVLTPGWNNGALSNAGAATWGNGTTGTTGVVTSQNSIVGQAANTGLQEIIYDDTVNGTFICIFEDEGTGRVRVGLQSPNQINFSRAQAQDMTIPPSLLTDTLNTGTAVTLQANNDLTISSDIISTLGAGALTLSAGKSALINANITTGNGSLNITANDLLSSGVVDANRDLGDATLSVADGVVIDVGSGNLTLSLLNGAGKTNSGSGNLTIGDGATLQCSGAGSMTLTAQENNIVLGNNSLLQTVNGNLMLSAGVTITGATPVTLQTTGTGELILITDALFPTAPLFGNGAITLPLATLTTAGGRLLIYTSQQSLNTLPATINGIAYVPGPEFIDSTTEKWGTYYPNSSGIPFTIFYKQPALPVPLSPSVITAAFYGAVTGVAGVFQVWRNPWYSDYFFAGDPYPPYLTPKGLSMRLPSLVEILPD